MIEKQYIKEGERLRKVRKKIGVSAETIAEKMGIVPNSYRQIEQGKAGFSMNLIKTLAANYQVNINWLLLEQGSMFINMDEIGSENGDKKHLLSPNEVSQSGKIYTHEELVDMVLDLKSKVSLLLEK